MPRSTVNLLGVDFHNLNLAVIIDELLSRPRSLRFAYIVTPQRRPSHAPETSANAPVYL